MRIKKVAWRMPNGIDYLLTEARPKDMREMIKKDPDKLGIPCYWARMEDGDLWWWPFSMEGEFLVKVNDEVS